jgi:hypothetical protein
VATGGENPSRRQPPPSPPLPLLPRRPRARPGKAGPSPAAGEASSSPHAMDRRGPTSSSRGVVRPGTMAWWLLRRAWSSCGVADRRGGLRLGGAAASAPISRRQGGGWHRISWLCVHLGGSGARSWGLAAVDLGPPALIRSPPAAVLGFQLAPRF